MDFLTLMINVLALVETGALLITLVFLTKAMKEKKANKNSPAIKSYYQKAGLAALVYLVLNIARNTGILG